MRLKLDSIGARIGAAVGVLLLGLVAVIATGLLGLVQLERHIDQLVHIDTVKGEAAARMRLAIVSRVDAVRNIALKTDINAMQSDQQRIDEVVKVYAMQREKLLALGLSEAEKTALAQADAAEAAAAPLLKQAQGLARTMQPEMAAEILTAKLGPVQGQWMSGLDELSAAAESGRAAQLAQAQASGTGTLLQMSLAGLAALAVGVAMAVVLAKGISRRLAQAVQVTQRIAAGDLSDVPRDSGRDEVAQTVNALADMQAHLRDTIGEVRSAVLANFGVDNLRFLTPVKAEDSLTVTLTAKQITPRQSADYGEVRWDAVVTNQNDEPVAAYDVLTLVAKPAASAPNSALRRSMASCSATSTCSQPP